MSLLATLLTWFLVISWPCVLLLLYRMHSTGVRFVLQTLFIIPIFFMGSMTLGFVGLMIKYLTFSLLAPEVRVFILSWITQQFWQFSLFMFEFWPNVCYLVSDENVKDDVFYLNSIIISNHSASPFDYISLGSLADYLERLRNSFVFMKKEFALVPAFGWIGSLNSAIPLQRDWSKDKRYIKDLCNKFKSNSYYRLVTPWVWFMYPEGTRLTQTKLEKAQQFARDRGFPVYNHLLQPRVKGFSYLTHHLYDALGCIIDTTVLYYPIAPKAYNFFVNTRLSKYTHIHLRVYRHNDIKNAKNDSDLSVLDQWLRDRWTEKDEIMERMKNNEIKYCFLDRSPWKATAYYVIWSILTVYLFCGMFAVGFNVFCILLIAAVFPAVIVGIEHSQNSNILPTDLYQKN